MALTMTLSFLRNDIYSMMGAGSALLANARTLYASTNAGDTMYVHANYYSGGDGEYYVGRGFLVTSLASIDTTQTITAASLNLRCTYTAGAARETRVEGFTETELTADDTGYGASDGTNMGEVDVDTVDTDYTITLNQDGLDYLNDNRGESEVVLVLLSEYDTDIGPPSTFTRPYTRFASPEHATIAYRPTLTITVETEPQETHWSDGMETTPTHVFRQGETVVLASTVTDSIGTDCVPTSATVTLTDAEGNVLLDAVAMTCTAGYVSYNYNVASDAPVGDWYAEIIVYSGDGEIAYPQTTTVYFEVTA